MSQLLDRLESLEKNHRELERRLKRWQALAVAAIVLGFLGSGVTPGIAAGSSSVSSKIRSLQAQVKTLQTKLARISIENNGDDIFISGANLHIVNGTNSTEEVNGLGNLIVGYNENRASFDPDPDAGPDVRTGSHNLVVGKGLNYRSAGCLVAGLENETRGLYASVTGGRHNIAGGWFSSVSGGEQNKASTHGAWVGGGAFNIAGNGGNSNNGWSAVAGGYQNVASGWNAFAGGGFGNAASGDSSSVTGGAFNEARHTNSTVSGGVNNLSAQGNEWRGGSIHSP